MVDVARLCLTEKLQCVDFFHKFRIRIGKAWVQSVALVDIDNLDSHNRCRKQVFPKKRIQIKIRAAGQVNYSIDLRFVNSAKTSLPNQFQ